MFGKNPKGYIIFTDEGRMMAYLEAENRYLEAENRKAPQTDEERAAALRTMHAYTGKYRLEGDKFVTKVNGAWNVFWVGTDQERFFKFAANQLHISTQWVRAPLFDNRMLRTFLVWERER